MNFRKALNEIGILAICSLVLFPASPVFALSCVDGFGKVWASTRLRALEEIQTLRIMTYNVQEFLNSEDAREVKPDVAHQIIPKSPEGTRGVAANILKGNPDIAVLQEIGMHAVMDLNKHHLGNAYRVLVMKGNDPSGIQIAFLVKKDLPFFVREESHKHIHFQNMTRLYPRDLPVLFFSLKQEGPPFLVLIGNHGKSMRDSPNDPKSSIMSAAGNQMQDRIVADYKSKYGPKVAIVSAGDFNRELRGAPEMLPLKKHFFDPLDLIEGRNRLTHFTFDKKARAVVGAQLDAILFLLGLESYLREVYVMPNQQGPGRQFSDHQPVVAVISTQYFWN